MVDFELVMVMVDWFFEAAVWIDSTTMSPAGFSTSPLRLPEGVEHPKKSSATTKGKRRSRYPPVPSSLCFMNFPPGSSLFVIGYLLFVICHCPLPTAHRPLVIRYLLFVTAHCVLRTGYSLLVIRQSSIANQQSPIGIRHSSFVIRPNPTRTPCRPR